MQQSWQQGLRQSLFYHISIGSLSTVAGSGLGEFKEGRGIEASFYWPSGVVLDHEGNILVADTCNDCIRRVNHEGSPQYDYFSFVFTFQFCFR